MEVIKIVPMSYTEPTDPKKIVPRSYIGAVMLYRSRSWIISRLVRNYVESVDM